MRRGGCGRTGQVWSGSLIQTRASGSAQPPVRIRIQLWSVYGAPGVYNGPLDWTHRPSPPEQDGQPSRQEPWQWRRARAELDLEVDYKGLLQQAFQSRLGPSWRERVREVVRLLLAATDQVVKATGLQFRAVMQPDQQMWFLPRTRSSSRCSGAASGSTTMKLSPSSSTAVATPRRWQLGSAVPSTPVEESHSQTTRRF